MRSHSATWAVIGGPSWQSAVVGVIWEHDPDYFDFPEMMARASGIVRQAAIPIKPERAAVAVFGFSVIVRLTPTLVTE